MNIHCCTHDQLIASYLELKYPERSATRVAMKRHGLLDDDGRLTDKALAILGRSQPSPSCFPRIYVA